MPWEWVRGVTLHRICYACTFPPTSRAREDYEGNADYLGLLAALLVEACGREHLDCIELLLQKMMKPSPKRNVRNKADLSDSAHRPPQRSFPRPRRGVRFHLEER